MSLNQNLAAEVKLTRPEKVQAEVPSRSLARWAEAPVLAAATDPGTISIFDVIGYDYWTDSGVTANRISAALRSIGNNPVTVQINSPGGDFFEGVAIYNLLRAHPAKVTVEVIGLAASAASVIAMASDELRMGQGAFLMIHNAWTGVVGNAADLRAAADTIEPFDGAMAGIYAARTGMSEKKVAELMAAETWIGAGEAVKMKFADSIMPDPSESLQASASVRRDVSAKRRIDAALSAQGVTRSERRAMMRDLSGTHDAAEPATHDAGVNAALEQLLKTIRS